MILQQAMDRVAEQKEKQDSDTSLVSSAAKQLSDAYPDDTDDD